VGTLIQGKILGRTRGREEEKEEGREEKRGGRRKEQIQRGADSSTSQHSSGAQSSILQEHNQGRGGIQPDAVWRWHGWSGHNQARGGIQPDAVWRWHGWSGEIAQE